MKRPFSLPVRRLHWIPMCLFALALGIILYDLLNEGYEWGQLLGGVISSLVMAGFWYFLYRFREVSYDQQFLYINGYGGEEKIPLNLVDLVLIDSRPTLFYKNWMIRYRNPQGEKGSVKIVVSGQKKKEAFNQNLRAANPQVVYRIESLMLSFGRRTTPTSLQK